MPKARANIADKMRGLVSVLRLGVHGIRFPQVVAECEDAWGEDYAIVRHFYYDYDELGDYFAHDRFRADLEEAIALHFDDESVKLTFYWTSQELEASRAA